MSDDGADPDASWSSRRSPRRRSTTRRTSASSTPSSATGTSATRWPAASRSSSSDWDELEYDDAGGLLKKTALVLTKRIGGTSGPIWGTAFLRAGGDA